MSYLIDIKEDLNEEVQEQLRKFKADSRGYGFIGWYRIQSAISRLRDNEIYHGLIENYIIPQNLFDENGDPLTNYYFRDPQEKQVNMVKKNLQVSSDISRARGRVTPVGLKRIMMEALEYRLSEYKNKTNNMEKLKILCIIGGSGCGKTLASLHLKYHKDANVICSFTTRPPRPTEVEGRDHHFIDIVPDKTDLIAYAHFGGAYYYATRWQVFGPCTVYVIDEKGLANLRKDFGDVYDIHTVLIKREPKLRLKAGVDAKRIRRDETRTLIDDEYDYVIENNGKKAHLFAEIERIYEEVKNK